MDRVETRGRVPLETLRARERSIAAWTVMAAGAALGGVAAGALLAACLRGCAPSACRAEVERQARRAALERNIRAGIYPEADWDAEEGLRRKEEGGTAWRR